ncbi:MAG: inositol 2-dehydrogenase [Peptococcaceae bacterium]|jgi:myo-inositol 2-dehydrogenase/D-chiro-inositol 1-dehydrogenase|nr:inositol 2-dehydrogenase [Peptococcaceae bacterium]
MINVGIIGAGRIGQVHARSILSGVPDAKILAIADPYLTDQAAAWAGGVGIEGIYKDYRQILTDPRVEAVLICSSTDTHASISLEAIKAGKHVFCEKPVDQTLARIDEVAEALRSSPKKLKYQVGFNRRFDHNYRSLRQAVLAGKIGELQFVRISSRDPEPPPAGYVKASGGIFIDMMIHDLDMLRYLSGREVVEVYAQGAVLIDPAIGEAGDVDSATVSAVLDNGALALIDNSRQAVYGYDQRAEVFGSLGSAQNANDAPSTAVISTRDGVVGEKPLWFFLERYMAAYQAEIQSFFQCVAADSEPEADLEAGRVSIRLALACKKSLAEHRPVKIAEIE